MAAEIDETYMRRALELAGMADAAGEVPVGAVLVKDGEVVGEGYNRPIGEMDPSAHAEIIALREGARRLGAYRIPDTTLYVTLEPCPMCVGAMVHARVARLVYGASDPKTGACGGALDLLGDASHNHCIERVQGVLGDEAGDRLRAFFRARRKSNAR